MKFRIIFACSIAFVLASCTSQSGPTQQQYDSVVAQNDSLKQVISELRLKINQLSFPADQRLLEIKKLINVGDFISAKSKIQDLCRIFPASDEAGKCSDLLALIEKKEAQKKTEEERIKALGFKAITCRSSFTIGYNKITISNISNNSRFCFDRYDDRYFYREADRGYKYVTATMTVQSSERNPHLPAPAVYKIVGDHMEYNSQFSVEFYQWSSYGQYLGNYADSKNDFAKVSTIKFSIGTEVLSEKLHGAYAVVCKNSNELPRSYDRFENPPVAYHGLVDYPKTLEVESFSKEYTLIKVYNLN